MACVAIAKIPRGPSLFSFLITVRAFLHQSFSSLVYIASRQRQMRVSTLLQAAGLLAASHTVAASSHPVLSDHSNLLRRATYDTVCPEGQYRYTNKCFPCQDVNALKCRMRGTIALECKQGTSLKNGACLIECGRRYRHDKITGTCVRCSDANAVTCTATEALSCSDKFLLNGVCVTQTACPTGTFPDIRTRACRSCSNLDVDAASCTRSSVTSW